MLDVTSLVVRTDWSFFRRLPLTLWYALFAKGHYPLSFTELLLSEPILRAVVSEGYTVATPVQVQAIPHALRGRDVLGSARRARGKPRRSPCRFSIGCLLWLVPAARAAAMPRALPHARAGQPNRGKLPHLRQARRARHPRSSSAAWASDRRLICSARASIFSLPRRGDCSI